MKRHAVSTLFLVFEIIILSIVIFMTFSIAKAYASSETTHKINIANDLQLMINLLVATPGDAVLAYPENLAQYTILLRSDGVQVWLPSDQDHEKIVRYFSLPKGYTTTGQLVQKEKLCLYKEQRTIILRACAS